MITAEVAIYPLKTGNASNVITHSIEALKQTNVNCTVDNMKTHMTGSQEDVFKGLMNMFDSAQSEGGEINMVVTVTNAAN